MTELHGRIPMPLVVAPILSILMFSCATPSAYGPNKPVSPPSEIQAYAGPRLPASDVVRLHVPAACVVYRVDGISQDEQFQGIIEFLPGNHSLAVGYRTHKEWISDTAAVTTKSGEMELRFLAERGKEYELLCGPLYKFVCVNDKGETAEYAAVRVGTADFRHFDSGGKETEPSFAGGKYVQTGLAFFRILEASPFGPDGDRICNAVRGGDNECVRNMLSANAKLANARSAIGCGFSPLRWDTPLYLAAIGDNRKAAELLVNAGADILGRVKGETPIHVAAFYGSTSIISMLIDMNVDVNVRCASGKTALYYAKLPLKGDDPDKTRRKERAAELLMAHGAIE